MAIPKLKDIARATGVHEMTVSRALRNVGRMRPETRQHVLDVARQLGYRAHAAAAAMRTGHTGCIAVLSWAQLPGSGIPPESLAEISETVSSHGGYLAHAVVTAAANDADATVLPRLLRRHMAEGVLLHGAQAASLSLEGFLRRNTLPAVWLNQKRRTNAVYPDEFGAAQKVTGKLLSLGHQRIAFVRLVQAAGSRSSAEHYSGVDRLAGYEAAMRQAGLRPELLVFDDHWNQWAEARALRLQGLAKVFCDPARRPTAAIVDRDGPVLLASLQQLGLQVPEDVSLVSFTSYGAHPVEQLVSWMPVPLPETGRLAVEMLFQMIERGSTDVPSISLPYGEIAAMHTVGKIGTAMTGLEVS